MANAKKIGLAVVTSTLAVVAGTAQAEELLSYESLGSGAELRAELAQGEQPNGGQKPPAQGQCGQAKCGNGSSNGTQKKTQDGTSGNGSSNGTQKKTQDGKCGQAKCGTSGQGK